MMESKVLLAILHSVIINVSCHIHLFVTLTSCSCWWHCSWQELLYSSILWLHSTSSANFTVRRRLRVKSKITVRACGGWVCLPASLHDAGCVNCPVYILVVCVYTIDLSRWYLSVSVCYFSDSVFCSIWIKVFIQAAELVIYIITLPLTHYSIIATHTCIILCFFLLPSLSLLLFFPLFCDCPADVLMSASGDQQEFLRLPLTWPSSLLLSLFS